MARLCFPILLLFICSCAAPVVSQRVLMPANESSMAKSRSLALLDFEGDYQDQFRQSLQTFLGNIRVNGQAYFNVVDRRAMDDYLHQNGLRRADRFDSRGAARIARLSGAETVLMGTAEAPHTELNRYSKKVEECVQYDQHNKCVESVVKVVYCKKRTSYFRFTLKTVSAANAATGFTRDYAATSASSRCRGDQNPLRPAAQLEHEAMQRAIAKIRRDVAPYNIVLRISLMPADKVIGSNKQAKDSFNSGLKMANQGRLNRGCEVFRSLLLQHKKSPALYYNAGVCAEVSGKLDEAKSLFINADRNSGKPNKLITSSIRRIDQKKINQDRVESQMN